MFVIFYYLKNPEIAITKITCKLSKDVEKVKKGQLKLKKQEPTRNVTF